MQGADDDLALDDFDFDLDELESELGNLDDLDGSDMDAAVDGMGTTAHYDDEQGTGAEAGAVTTTDGYELADTPLKMVWISAWMT
ncbi:MAG: hypothetical protein R3E89_16085 [Thiolinea sp.]